MIVEHTPDSLRAFELEVAAEFNSAKIRAPVHLAGGNEEQLVDIFRSVRPYDWVATTWRSHYHCLLKGVPPGKLKADILAGRSITLCYPEHRVISSAIVGGALPIALGLAWSAKRDGKRDERVWAFTGDMAAMGGTFHECVRYAEGHDLPITFVVEDNGKSVCTDTMVAWGGDSWGPPALSARCALVRHIHYDLPWPHSGAGQRINF